MPYTDQSFYAKYHSQKIVSKSVPVEVPEVRRLFKKMPEISILKKSVGKFVTSYYGHLINHLF